MIKLYRNLEALEPIVLSGDPGEGISFAAGVCISKKYHDVPLVYHARIESPAFGNELYKMGLFVKKKTGDFPLLAVERNIGAATIAKLIELEYPYGKLYRQKTFDRILRQEEDRIGWVTTSTNRRKMLDDLALAIRRKELKVYDKDIVDEMLTFIIAERTGEPRPERNHFSDLIMALAIANQIAGENRIAAKWAPTIEKKEKDNYLPEKAEGFITEKWQEKRDWRSG